MQRHHGAILGLALCLIGLPSRAEAQSVLDPVRTAYAQESSLGSTAPVTITRASAGRYRVDVPYPGPRLLGRSIVQVTS